MIDYSVEIKKTRKKIAAVNRLRNDQEWERCEVSLDGMQHEIERGIMQPFLDSISEALQAELYELEQDAPL